MSAQNWSYNITERYCGAIKSSTFKQSYNTIKLIKNNVNFMLQLKTPDWELDILNNIKIDIKIEWRDHAGWQISSKNRTFGARSCDMFLEFHGECGQRRVGMRHAYDKINIMLKNWFITIYFLIAKYV